MHMMKLLFTKQVIVLPSILHLHDFGHHFLVDNIVKFKAIQLNGEEIRFFFLHRLIFYKYVIY